MTDTRFLHVTVRCPSCGHSVDLGAKRLRLDLDLNRMYADAAFEGAHTCKPPEPTGIFEFRGDVDEETVKRARALIEAFRGRKA